MWISMSMAQIVSEVALLWPVSFHIPIQLAHCVAAVICFRNVVGMTYLKRASGIVVCAALGIMIAMDVVLTLLSVVVFFMDWIG